MLMKEIDKQQRCTVFYHINQPRLFGASNSYDAKYLIGKSANL